MELRILTPKDVTKAYVEWMQDKEVVKYSENQYKIFSINSQKIYVKNCLSEKDIVLYGIFIKSKHVGNISLKGLNSIHKRAELTYMIGVKQLWGKGLGNQIVSKIVSKAKEEYKLKKLYQVLRLKILRVKKF